MYALMCDVPVKHIDLHTSTEGSANVNVVKA